MLFESIFLVCVSLIKSPDTNQQVDFKLCIPKLERERGFDLVNPSYDDDSFALRIEQSSTIYS